MGKVIEVHINGEAYPCSMTMGAMLRFHEQTGRDVTEFNGALPDMCALMWAMVMSSASRLGKPLNFSLMEFCDNIDPEEMSRCWEAVQADQQQSEEPKKKKSAS